MKRFCKAVVATVAISAALVITAKLLVIYPDGWLWLGGGACVALLFSFVYAEISD